jgi:transcriptional regulator with XRE-family HTH domain
VREVPTERSWSQERLAERAGMHRTFIGHVERGENQVTLETLCRLAKALDVRPSTLVEHLPT